MHRASPAGRHAMNPHDLARLTAAVLGCLLSGGVGYYIALSIYRPRLHAAIRQEHKLEHLIAEVREERDAFALQRDKAISDVKHMLETHQQGVRVVMTQRQRIAALTAERDALRDRLARFERPRGAKGRFAGKGAVG